MNQRSKTPIRNCPNCCVPMQPCDYSPIYGHSWYHPEDDDGSHCEHSGSVLFGGFDISFIEDEDEDEEE